MRRYLSFVSGSIDRVFILAMILGAFMFLASATDVLFSLGIGFGSQTLKDTSVIIPCVIAIYALSKGWIAIAQKVYKALRNE